MAESRIGASVPRTQRPFRRWLGRTVLAHYGWTLDMQLPDEPQLVVLAAPHTSNWDFVFAVATIFALDLRIALMAKHTLFRWPFGAFFRWAGLIPVNRSAPQGAVGEMTRAFAQNPQLVIGLAPEGTRRRVEKWKSGFWQIARAAQVPIACAYLDYERKVAGANLVLRPSDDYEADLARIREYYRHVKPHTSSNFAP